jgi:iron complex outermembrane receptor protein
MIRKRILLSIVGSMILANSTLADQTLSKLDDVIITAHKLEQNVQEVPVSISVLDEKRLEDNNIKTLSDLATYVPNFSQTTIDSGMYIPSMRGIVLDAHTYTTSVATYVDGVPYLNSIGNDILLDNIERVEVLKGPQGTLYGKSAYAGVINIITKKPDNSTQGKIKLELGEDNKQAYSLSVSGPILKDKFYAGLSLAHYEKDGQLQNTYKDKKDDDREDNKGKLYLRYTPSDSLDISWITSHLKKNDGGPSQVSISDTTPRNVQRDYDGYSKSYILSNALKVEYAMDNMDFSSISTFKKYTDDRGYDYDGTSASLYYAQADSKYKDYSQELRLDGQKDKLIWLGGLYLDKNKAHNILTLNSGGYVDNEGEVSNIGIFSNIDYHLKDDLVFIAGLRYDKDKVDISDNRSTYAADKSYNEVSPKIGLKYFYTDDFMPYLTISKGYKRGGYYIFAADNDNKSYDKETLWNYETGFKAQALDDKLTFNLSIFYMDIKDMHVVTNLSAFSSYVSNAAEATSKGFEIDTNYKLNSNLEIFAAFGYSKTTFDKFEDSLGTYTGNTNPYAPEYTYTLGTSYRGDNGVFAKMDIRAQGSIYTDKANKYKSPGYKIVNAKVGYETKDYEVYLYSDNLTDENYDIQYYASRLRIVSDARETGVSFTYKF